MVNCFVFPFFSFFFVLLVPEFWCFVCLFCLFVCFCPNIFLASFLGTCPSLKGALGALLIINPIDLVGGHHSFQFDQTFGHTASNKRVYKHAAAEIVQAACDGGVGTIFMFGQTGSGKTHTMLLGRKRWVKFLAFWWPWHAWHQQFLQNKGANDSFSFFSTFFLRKQQLFLGFFCCCPTHPPLKPWCFKVQFFFQPKKNGFFRSRSCRVQTSGVPLKRWRLQRFLLIWNHQKTVTWGPRARANFPRFFFWNKFYPLKMGFGNFSTHKNGEDDAIMIFCLV